MNTEAFGRAAFAQSRNPYTCGITGRGFTAADVAQRVDSLAKALAETLGWSVHDGSEWDKVACVFSINTVRTPTTSLQRLRSSSQLLRLTTSR